VKNAFGQEVDENGNPLPAVPPLAPAPTPPLLALDRPAGGSRPAGLPPLGVPVPQSTPAPPTALPVGLPGNVTSETKPPAAVKPRPAAPPKPDADAQRLGAIAADETAAAKALGDARVEQAQAVAEAKVLEVAERERQQQAEAARLAAREQEKSKIDAQAAADSDAAKKAGFRGYWADKSTGTKILAAISVALGGIGQALQAKAGRPMGENSALKIINDAIAMDWQKQRESIAKLEREAEKSGAQRDHIAAEVGLMQAAHRKNALDLATAQAEQRIAALGPTNAAAAAQGALAGLRREQMDAEKKLEAHKAQVADTRAATELKRAEAAHQRAAAAAAGAKPGEKPATEGQGKANAYLYVMLDEAKKIEKLPPLSEAARSLMFQELALKNAAEKNPTIDYTARLTGVRKAIESKLKGTDKQVYSAYSSFLDPYVRSRSGANALPSEVAALAGPIIPAMGDKRSELDDKRARRRVILEGVAEMSNQSDVWRRRIADAYGSAAASSPATAPKLSTAEKATLMEFIRKNPNDPRAARARQILQGGQQIAAR
jgi:hypothetical protein